MISLYGFLETVEEPENVTVVSSIHFPTRYIRIYFFYYRFYIRFSTSLSPAIDPIQPEAEFKCLYKVAGS